MINVEDEQHNNKNENIVKVENCRDNKYWTSTFKIQPSPKNSENDKKLENEAKKEEVKKLDVKENPLKKTKSIINDKKDNPINLNYISSEVNNNNCDQIQSKIEEESEKIKENIKSEKKEKEKKENLNGKNNYQKEFNESLKNSQNEKFENTENPNDIFNLMENLTEDDIKNAPVLTIYVN